MRKLIEFFKWLFELNYEVHEESEWVKKQIMFDVNRLVPLNGWYIGFVRSDVDDNVVTTNTGSALYSYDVVRYHVKDISFVGSGFVQVSKYVWLGTVTPSKDFKQTGKRGK